MRLFFIGLLIIVSMFGDHLYSLNVDLAHHFAVVDALMKYGTNAQSNLGFMSLYPTLSYWPAAYIGHALGSGLVAMTLVSVMAIYVSYYFAGSLLEMTGAKLESFIVFLALIFLFSLWCVVVGFEIVSDCFYPQLVGTAVYFACLYVLARAQINITSVLGTVAATLVLWSLHPVLPAALVGAFATTITVYLVLILIEQRRLDKYLLTLLATLLALSVAGLFVHPSFAAFRSIAANDGFISEQLPISATVIFGVISSVASGWSILKEKNRSQAAIITFAASASTTFLMAGMWIGFREFGAVSMYSVKKYSYLVVCTSSLALAYSIKLNAGMSSNTRIREYLAPLTAITLSTIVLARSPVPILHEIIDQQRYAESALQTSHPNFKPGNTAVMVNGMHNAVRYMISVSASKMSPSGPTTVRLLLGDFDIKTVDYVMMAKADVNIPCDARFAESSKYAIVPVKCFKTR